MSTINFLFYLKQICQIAVLEELRESERNLTFISAKKKQQMSAIIINLNFTMEVVLMCGIMR